MKRTLRSCILLIVGVLIGWALGAAFSDFYLPISSNRVNAYKWEVGIEDGRGSFSSSLPRGSYAWHLRDADGKKVEPEAAGLDVEVFIGEDAAISTGAIRIDDGRFTRVRIEVSPESGFRPDQTSPDTLVFRAVF